MNEILKFVPPNFSSNAALRIMGLENFIAKNLDEYIKKAVQFRRQEISTGNLTDTKNFVESVYNIFLNAKNFNLI